jgi:hypothetical protein
MSLAIETSNYIDSLDTKRSNSLTAASLTADIRLIFPLKGGQNELFLQYSPQRTLICPVEDRNDFEIQRYRHEQKNENWKLHGAKHAKNFETIQNVIYSPAFTQRAVPFR